MENITEEQLFIDNLPEEMRPIATKFGAKLFAFTMEMGYAGIILIGLENEVKGDEFLIEGISRIEEALSALAEDFIKVRGWSLDEYKSCHAAILELGAKTNWKIDHPFITTH